MSDTAFTVITETELGIPQDAPQLQPVVGTEILWHFKGTPAYLVTTRPSEVEGEGPEEAIDPPQPIPLVDGKAKDRYTQDVEHVAILPQYPVTKPGGYTYCINIDGMNLEQHHNPARKTMRWEPTIQYSHARTNMTRGAVKSPFLRNALGHRHQWKCTGIKFCNMMPVAEATKEHSFVDQAMWDKIDRTRPLLDEAEPNPLCAAAIREFNAIKLRFEKNDACRKCQRATCRPLWKKSREGDIDGVYYYFVICSNWIPTQNHFYKPYTAEHQISLELLERLFEPEAPILPPNLDRSCNMFQKQTTRMKNCSFPHPNTSPYISTPCEVRFETFIPEDLIQTPYILFTSRGVHKHLPPPPNRLPNQLAADVADLMRRYEDPTLTTGKFLLSAQLKSYSKDKGVRSLTQLHIAFANKSRIRAMIHFNRLTVFPEGREIRGLHYLFEHERRNPDTAYLQGIWNDQFGLMIICFHKIQATLLLKRRSFKIDMSFQRLRRQDVKEVTIAAFDESERRVRTLARAFISGEDGDTYATMFERIFEIVERLTGQKPRWRHLDTQPGFVAVVSDMGGGQLRGLGLYLQKIDPLQRPIEYQLVNILVICRIHFKRSVEQTVGPLWSSYAAGRHMMALLSCHSRDAFYQILHAIFYDHGYMEWANHKSHPVIAAGLNMNCSSIPNEVFERVRNQMDAVGQSHNKAYSAGKWLELVPAIEATRTMDLRDGDEFVAYGYAVNSDDRSQSMQANKIRDMGRDARKRQKILDSGKTLPIPDNEDFDYMHPIGVPRVSSFPTSIASSRGSRSGSRSGSCSGSQVRTMLPPRRTGSITPSESISNTGIRLALPVPTRATTVAPSQTAIDDERRVALLEREVIALRQIHELRNQLQNQTRN